MATEAAAPATTAQLRRNALGLPQVVFQGITHIAPSLNIVFTFPIIALKAGPDMPISFLLTTIVCFFIGNTVSQFSKYMPSSGGYYSFATRGLGARSGFMTTWSYLIYDIIGPAGAIGFLGYLASSTIQTASGVNVPGGSSRWPRSLSCGCSPTSGSSCRCAPRRCSAAIEMLIMLALAITFLVHPGHGSSFSAPLQPSHSPHQYGGILAGMVFSVLALSGFEAPAPLAQETQRPGKFIGRAVMLSLFADRRSSTSSPPTPARSAGAPATWPHSRPTRTRTTRSATRCGAPAGGSSSSRSSTAPSAWAWPAPTRRPASLYTMGQAGTLPARFGRIHPVHRTPTFAIAVQQANRHRRDPAGRPAAGARGHLRFPRHDHDARGHRAVHHGQPGADRLHPPGASGRLQLLAARGAALVSARSPCCRCLVPSIPVPAWPYNITPYLFIAALIIGFGYMHVARGAQPGRAAPWRDGAGRAYAPTTRVTSTGTRHRRPQARDGRSTPPGSNWAEVELPTLRSARRSACSTGGRPTGPGWPRRRCGGQGGPGRAARLRRPGAFREPRLPDRVRPSVRGGAADPGAGPSTGAAGRQRGRGLRGGRAGRRRGDPLPELQPGEPAPVGQPAAGANCWQDAGIGNGGPTAGHRRVEVLRPRRRPTSRKSGSRRPRT